MVLMLALTGLFCSCSQVEDARHVVAEADSLRTAGIAYDDSLSIAEAAATLSHVRNIYPIDYARANYYYGRLLRTRGDQPAAMLAFLNVVHSRTEDHTIKGRSWSNIANICRIAADHELAYDIYKYSADEFLKANDSTAYYYALNNMAVDLAEMNREQETISLFNIITEQCSINEVLIKILETKAIFFFNIQQYDSAIFYINQFQHFGNQEPTGYLVKAQAFDGLGQKDSAVYYAQKTIENAPTWFDLNNAYYIIANDDSNKNKEEVLQIAADRSDVQKLIEVRQGKLSQATQLLQQDLNRKPNLGWLFAMVGTSLAIGVIIVIYMKRKRRKHQLVSQQVNDLLQKHDELSARTYLLEQKLSQRQKKMLFEIESFCKTIQNDSDLKKKLSWNDFDKMCAVADERMYGLATKLKERYNMDLNNLRLCILITIGNFTNSEMADLLSYDEHTFRTIKNRVARNLNISGKNMRDFFLNLMIGS